MSERTGIMGRRVCRLACMCIRRHLPLVYFLFLPNHSLTTLCLFTPSFFHYINHIPSSTPLSYSTHHCNALCNVSPCRSLRNTEGFLNYDDEFTSSEGRGGTSGRSLWLTEKNSSLASATWHCDNLSSTATVRARHSKIRDSDRSSQASIPPRGGTITLSILS